MYKVVKRYYDKGIYDKEKVGRFVKAGKLSKEEYQEITGEGYGE